MMRYDIIEAWKEILLLLIYYFFSSPLQHTALKLYEPTQARGGGIEIIENQKSRSWRALVGSQNWKVERKRPGGKFFISTHFNITHSNEFRKRCTVWGFHTGSAAFCWAKRTLDILFPPYTLNHIHQQHFKAPESFSLSLVVEISPAEQPSRRADELYGERHGARTKKSGDVPEVTEHCCWCSSSWLGAVCCALVVSDTLQTHGASKEVKEEEEKSFLIIMKEYLTLHHIIFFHFQQLFSCVRTLCWLEARTVCEHELPASSSALFCI